MLITEAARCKQALKIEFVFAEIFVSMPDFPSEPPLRNVTRQMELENSYLRRFRTNINHRNLGYTRQKEFGESNSSLLSYA